MRIFLIALVVVGLACPPAFGAGQPEDGKKEGDAGSAHGPSSATPGTKDGKKPDAIQAILDRVGQMAPTDQQAWLARLEQRAIHAARLTLRPDDAARQQARIRAQLHQKTITWQVLREVIRDTDAREKVAIDWLVRTYRTLVFDNFHKEADTFERRRQAWLDVYSSWAQAGSQFDQQDRLIRWLELAVRSATPATIGPLPEKPEFESAQSAAEAASKQPAKDAKPQEPPKSVTAEKPKADQPQSPTPPIVKEPANDVKPKESAKPAEPSKPRISEKAEQKTATTMQHVVERPARSPKSAMATPSGSDTHAAALPHEAERPKDEATSAGRVEIKADDLSARISSCNMAFRALEAELDEKHAWTAAQLEPLAERLKVLVLRRHDLNLFRNAIPEDKRASIERLTLTKTAVSQFAACIVAARAKAKVADFDGTDAEQEAELKHLDGLSRRLAEMMRK